MKVKTEALRLPILIVVLGYIVVSLYSQVQLRSEVKTLQTQLVIEQDKVLKVQKERQDDLTKFGEVIAEKDASISELFYKVEEKQMSVEENVIRAEVTSYAPLDPDAVEGMCYSGDPSITATGTTVRYGVAAADFSKLPAGTVLEIPGYGIAVVEDTGSALRKHDGYAIDVFMPTRGEALAWGRQHLDVKIVYMPEK
jgi:3D (Asp-Asp-Asp) domain-containing protein